MRTHIFYCDFEPQGIESIDDLCIALLAPANDIRQKNSHLALVTSQIQPNDVVTAVMIVRLAGRQFDAGDSFDRRYLMRGLEEFWQAVKCIVIGKCQRPQMSPLGLVKQACGGQRTIRGCAMAMQVNQNGNQLEKADYIETTGSFAV